MQSDRVGEVHKTNNYGYLEIKRYNSSNDVDVIFLDTGFETKTQYSRIVRGSVMDKYKPSVCGVGIVGECEVSDSNGVLRHYNIWNKMLKRCYKECYNGSKPTYTDTFVSENFKYFSFFKSWCEGQIGFYKQHWELDKDILNKSGNTYSEDFCCFVPRELNVLFTNCKAKRGDFPIGVSKRKHYEKYRAYISIDGIGRSLGIYNTPEEAFLVYKQAKEDNIKVLAIKWKDQIDPRVYEALMNYQVEITD